VLKKRFFFSLEYCILNYDFNRFVMKFMSKNDADDMEQKKRFAGTKSAFF